MTNRLPDVIGCAARLMALLALFAGCSKSEVATVENFTPPGDAALEALETALTGWQNGDMKPGSTENADTGVHIADPAWSKGVKLKSFEIVKALPGESPRKFSVKLNLEGTVAPEEFIYIVHGNDPLWVMRESEWERDSGM